MPAGLHSTIATLQEKLFLRWVPKWREAFWDHRIGGFYERLGKAFQPVFTGQRRLVTQCRQLSIYAHYALKTRQLERMRRDLTQAFDHIVKRYHDPKTGRWRFSLDDEGRPKDDTCDLYALTFVIFSFCHYYRATLDERAKARALEVLSLIDADFRLDKGFAESIAPDGRVIAELRRQDPHMHLLEACLFAHETWGDPVYERMADELVALFYKRFFEEKTCALPEDYTTDLSPHPEKGAVYEPGHYYEWVWLLKKHADIKGDKSLHNAVCLTLLTHANRYGWDTEFGGIYDAIGPGGTVIEETKRIWPFCEALKANALMIEHVGDRQELKDRVTDMVRVFSQKYMRERGFWTEWLHRDLTPAADYMPGTTPYHVYFGITETMDILNRRGAGKSWRGQAGRRLYGLRRKLSRAVRFFKHHVSGGNR